jgi:hypothetical protein
VAMQKHEIVDEILAELDMREEIEWGRFMDETAYSTKRSELMDMTMEEIYEVAKKLCIDCEGIRYSD